MIIPYKNREVDLNKPVKVYRNLHAKSLNERFSVQQDGLVVGHTDDLKLMDVTFKVGEVTRQRVIREKRKRVHAFMVGFIADSRTFSERTTEVKYDPYKFGYFYCLSGLVVSPVRVAITAEIRNGKVYIL